MAGAISEKTRSFFERINRGQASCFSLTMFGYNFLDFWVETRFKNRQRQKLKGKKSKTKEIREIKD